MTAGKPIVGLANPIIQPDSKVKLKRPHLLKALFMDGHNVGVPDEVVDVDKGDYFSFEEKVESCYVPHSVDAAEVGDNVVEGDDC